MRLAAQGGHQILRSQGGRRWPRSMRPKRFRLTAVLRLLAAPFELHLSPSTKWETPGRCIPFSSEVRHKTAQPCHPRLLALVVLAGCASTEVTERQRYEGEKLSPSASSSMTSRRTLRGAADRRSRPRPARPGARKGSRSAWARCSSCQGAGGGAAPHGSAGGAGGPGGPPPQPDDIVLRGYFVSVDEAAGEAPAGGVRRRQRDPS